MSATIGTCFRVGRLSAALVFVSHCAASADTAPTARFMLNTGLPVLTREIAYDSDNNLLITGDAGSGTVLWDVGTARQIYFIPRRKDRSELFLVSVPGVKGTFISNHADPTVLQFGRLSSDAPDWTFANPDSKSWTSVETVPPSMALASDGFRTYLLDFKGRTTTLVRGLEQCYSRRSLFVQPGTHPRLAGCTFGNEIRIVDLSGKASPRLLHATTHAFETQISADGRYLVSLTAIDDPPTMKKLEIWDLSKDAAEAQTIVHGPDNDISSFALEIGRALNLYTTSGFTGHIQHWECSTAPAAFSCRSVLNVKAGEVSYPSVYGIALAPGGLLYVGRERDILALRSDTLQQIGKFELTTHVRIREAGFLGENGFFATGLDVGALGFTTTLVSTNSDRILADSISNSLAERGTEPRLPIYEISSDDAKRAVRADNRYVNNSVIDLKSSRELANFNGTYSAFDRSGRFVAYVEDPIATHGSPKLCSIDLQAEDRKPLCHPTARDFRTQHIAVSEEQIAAAQFNGTKLPNGEYDNSVRIWNRRTGKLEGVLPRSKVWVSSLEFSRDSKNLLVTGFDVAEWRTFPQLVTEEPVFSYADTEGTVAKYAGDDSQLFVGYSTGAIRIFDRGQAQPVRELEGHVSDVETLAVGDRTGGIYRDVLLSGGHDGVLRGWNIKACRAEAAASPCTPLFSVIQRDHRQWVVTAKDGRFDTSTFDREKSLSWVVSDDALRPLPIEIFTRDFFEPRLLTKLLDGKKFESVPNIASLNRVQPARPEIRVTSNSRHPEIVTVTVKVATARREFEVHGKKVTKGTGVYDVRLFRDGQLVAVSPRRKLKADPAVETKLADKLENWRERNRVLSYRDNEIDSTEISFPGIRLPSSSETNRVTFTAYAFNDDRIKSETAELSIDLPKGLRPRAPRAYVITIGVSSFEDASWNLQYAANDAWEAGQELARSLTALRAPNGNTPKYDDVVRISLIGGTTTTRDGEISGKFSQARKEQIRAVFLKLAGEKVDTSSLRGVDSADRLRRVNPEDLLIILVSTHGMVDKDGVFYFLPQNIGAKFSPFEESDLRARQHMLTRAVSSEELADWMEHIDATDQIIVIDACHSAASVQSPDFKPGPLGSRGLGQLAFDKGMRVLSATQVDQAAVEKDSTHMGLLTYALIEDGLRKGKAITDGSHVITAAKLLEYAKSRVPEIYLELDAGTLSGTKGAEIYSEGNDMRSLLQQPDLFNFARASDIAIKEITNDVAEKAK